MAVRRRSRILIYPTRFHLVATFFFISLPLVFLIAASGVAHIGATQILSELGVSLWRMAVAYIIAAVLGWIAAVSFYRGRAATIALPLFDVLQSFPTFALLPLVTYLWGRTGVTVILFLSVTVLWPVFFSVVSSLKLMKRDWEESVEIVGLKGFDYFKLFLLPISVPGLITGSIIGLGDGWEALVATEIIVNVRTGLGRFFQQYANNATITTIGVLGFLLLIFAVNKLVWSPLLDWSHRQMEE